MITIYLSGPMADCTDEEMHGWRDEVKDKFTVERAAGRVVFLDPTVRDFRNREVTPDEIVEPDLDEIDASTVLLANCWKTGTGTSMEIFYAAGCHGKLVIAVVPPGKFVSPWLAYHALVVRELSEAIAIVKREFEL